MIGNRGGYIELAMSALKAAQGSTQTFKNAKWLQVEDFDWGINGLKFDARAHVYLRLPESLFSKIIHIVLALAFLVVLVVGVGTIGYWIFHIL